MDVLDHWLGCKTLEVKVASTPQLFSAVCMALGKSTDVS